MSVRIGVLASGQGSNLQAILDACADGRIPGKVEIVISDRKKAYALERAERAGVKPVFISPRKFRDRIEYDGKLIEALAEARVDLVCLAGFMRILSEAFVNRFYGRCLNIHPALLPSFPGLHAQRQAFDYGVKVAGCTVHFVDSGVDTGPIIAQKAVPVLEGDTPDTLADRILEKEHVAYPEAIRLFAEGRLVLEGRRVAILPEP